MRQWRRRDGLWDDGVRACVSLVVWCPEKDPIGECGSVAQVSVQKRASRLVGFSCHATFVLGFLSTGVSCMVVQFLSDDKQSFGRDCSHKTFLAYRYSTPFFFLLSFKSSNISVWWMIFSFWTLLLFWGKSPFVFSVIIPWILRITIMIVSLLMS